MVSSARWPRRPPLSFQHQHCLAATSAGIFVSFPHSETGPPCSLPQAEHRIVRSLVVRFLDAMVRGVSILLRCVPPSARCGLSQRSLLRTEWAASTWP